MSPIDVVEVTIRTTLARSGKPATEVPTTAMVVIITAIEKVEQLINRSHRNRIALHTYSPKFRTIIRTRIQRVAVKSLTFNSQLPRRSATVDANWSSNLFSALMFF
jgi:hypothetical protein